MQQGQNLEEEEAHLIVALRGSGYPSSFKHSAATARTPREVSGHGGKERDTGGKSTLGINTLCSEG